MNVEKISALEQIKAMLSRAYNVADRQLSLPFGDKESVASYLLTKIHTVTNEIDAFISEEENAFEAYYSEDGSTNVNIEIEDFPLHDDSEIPVTVMPNPNSFNPVIHDCAAEITAAFGDCWVEVKVLKHHNGSHPNYTISIQPDGYTPNDIQLKLKSLGYVPAFKSIKDLDRCAWAYFDVVYPRVRGQGGYNGITFELSSTVDDISPPELERYSEPATDDELPF